MRIQGYLFYISLVLVIFIILAGQLLWLFDPVGSDVFWIEILNRIMMLAAIIPFIWIVFALTGIVKLYQIRSVELKRTAATELILYAATIIVSAVLIIFIFTSLNEWLWIGILSGTSCLLVWASVLLTSSRKSKSAIQSVVTQLILFILVLTGLLFPMPYTVVTPGMTMNMNDYAVVQSKAEQANDNTIMGVLIFDRPAFPVDWLYAQWFPHYEFRKQQKNDLPLGEQLQRVQALKVNANQIGSAIGFEKAGVGKGITYEGVRIIEIVEDSPAGNVLKQNDLITKLNGKKINHVNDLIKAFEQIAPGKQVQMTIDREGEILSVQAKTIPNPNDEKRAILGIHITSEMNVDLPFNVYFKPYVLHVGGPSHGAMLALSIVDQLVPGGVTNGNRVAGTGTIRIDGTIGPIGGVTQKAYTVERVNADVFFVPASQWQDAKKGADQLEIVPVETLDEILMWLKENPKPQHTT